MVTIGMAILQKTTDCGLVITQSRPEGIYPQTVRKPQVSAKHYTNLEFVHWAGRISFRSKKDNVDLGFPHQNSKFQWYQITGSAEPQFCHQPRGSQKMSKLPGKNQIFTYPLCIVCVYIQLCREHDVQIYFLLKFADYAGQAEDYEIISVQNVLRILMLEKNVQFFLNKQPRVEC